MYPWLSARETPGPAQRIWITGGDPERKARRGGKCTSKGDTLRDETGGKRNIIYARQGFTVPKEKATEGGDPRTGRQERVSQKGCLEERRKRAGCSALDKKG